MHIKNNFAVQFTLGLLLEILQKHSKITVHTVT